MKKSVYVVTTAIDYVNNLPHIGTAYEKIGADVVARFKRLQGIPVFFLMGNDEHSINVKREALAQGLTPLAYCDKMADQFQQIWRKLHISYDDFIRTTEERHAIAIRTLFQKIYEAGDIYLSTYRGLYCESCEAFLREKDVRDGRCPQHGTIPQWLEEKNYFFALSKYAEPIERHIREKETFIMPEIRRNEIINVLKAGLEDISISRSTFDWGVPLPIDPSHVVYVWFDALINYISALGYGWDQARFEQHWPADLHIIGKDITRFHCIVWPAMLMSAGLELPRMVFGHGFIYLKGEKMSMSLGNIVTPMDIVDVYGADSLRYYLLRDTSFGKDGDFTWENFMQRHNSDLANDLGNLLNRTLKMIHQYRNGLIPAQDLLHAEDIQLKEDCEKLFDDVKALLDPASGDIHFHAALARIWNTINHANRYIDKTAPWALHKAAQHSRLDTVLYCTAECLRIVSCILAPFLPETAAKIQSQLGLSTAEAVETKDALRWGKLAPHTRIGKPSLLFPRIETISRPPAADTTSPAPASDVPYISIHEFKKLDLRVGRIIDAEPMSGSDKLLKLTVDIGQVRTIVAGIGKAYSPEDLKDKKVVVVANLKPITLRGVVSEGMILAAGPEDALALVTLEKDAPAGERIS